MSSYRRVSPSFAVLLVALLACAGPLLGCGHSSSSEPDAPRRYEPAQWNQERVVAIARDLDAAVRRVYEAFRQEPERTIGSGQSAAFYRLQQTIRRLRSRSTALLAKLEAGEGRDKTLSLYREIRTLIRDAEEEGRRLLAQEPLLDAAAAAGGAIIRLAPYYGVS